MAVWLDKVGLGGPERDSRAMAVGRGLERAVLGLAAEVRRERLTHNGVTFPHPEALPLFATPDGFTRGRRGVAEVKVVGHHWGDWTDGPPAYVVSQVQAQMACLPRATFALVIALQGSDLRTYEVGRDPDLIAALESDVIAWWDAYVVPEVAPLPESEADRWALVRVLAARAPDRVSRPPTDAEELMAARLASLMAEADRIERDAKPLRLALAELAAGADLRGDTWTGKWTTRRTVDYPALIGALGVSQALLESYQSLSLSFTFRRAKVDQAAEAIA